MAKLNMTGLTYQLTPLNRYSNSKIPWLGGPLEYRTFWTINRVFSVRFSDHHSNRTQIYPLNTRLVRYSDGYYIYFQSRNNSNSQTRGTKPELDNVSCRRARKFEHPKSRNFKLRSQDRPQSNRHETQRNFVEKRKHFCVAYRASQAAKTRVVKKWGVCRQQTVYLCR